MLTQMANELKQSIWIRAAQMGAGKCDRTEAALFRLEFELADDVQEAKMRISAADRYRLYVNGVSVVCGPRKGDKWNRYYETVDLVPYLQKGENYITARVISYPFESVLGSMAAPGSVYVSEMGAVLMTDGEICLANGAKVALSTGKAEWTAIQDLSFDLKLAGALYTGATERFLAEKYLDWRANRPMGWEKAVKAFGSGINDYGEFSPLQLKARAIPNMEEIEDTFISQLENLEGENGFQFDENGDAVIPAHTARAVELDAGKLRTAYLRMKTQGAGGNIRVIYAERYFPREESMHSGPMRRDDRENGCIDGRNGISWPAQYDEIDTAQCETLFENFWFRTFRFVRIEVTAGDQDVRVHMPDFIVTRYPLRVTAEMDFPNEKMAKLWEISVRTLRNCMHETHEDCPYYEQLQYTLDTRLQMQFTYAVSGDTRMAENVLWDFHCSQLPDGIMQSRYPCTHTQVIPDFSIYWIFMLEEHYIQTGDASKICFYRSTMDKMLDYFDRHIGAMGLAEHLGYWEFGDWVDQWDEHRGTPDATWHGPAALHNLTYALGLRTAARLMRVIGREGDACGYETRADEICANVIRHCYDRERGMIMEGPNFKQYSQHSQALAVLCGALDGVEAINAMRGAMAEKDVLACTFPWQYTLLRALEKVGLYELSEPVWEQYFSMLDRHLTTVPERPGDTRSDCHAWSALPLYEYPRMLLGVQPEKPGWESAVIQPRAIGIDHLSGSVPTPKGAVQVNWHKEQGIMHIEVSAPMPIKVIVNGNVYESADGQFSI